MTVTLIDVPGPIERGASYSFSATRPITSVSIQFYLPTDGDPEDPDSVPTGPRETAYDGTDASDENGTFAHLYRSSTSDGTTWTIARENGWPRPFRVAIKEGRDSGGIGGGGIAPNLAPIFGPDCWYVLDPISRLIDQSGNGHDLASFSTPIAAAGPALGYVSSRAGKLRHTGTAAFRTAGEISFVAMINLANVSETTWFVGCEDAGASWSTWWKYGVESGRLCYGCDRGPSLEAQVFEYLSPPDVIAADGWQIIAATRSATGVSKGYVEGALTGTYSQGTPAVGGASAYLALMQDGFLATSDHLQMMIGIWLREITADEIADVTLALRGVLS